MENVSKFKKLVLFISILLSVVFLYSCEGSSIYRERHGLIKEFVIDYVINSIRVDDDGEYHIVAVSDRGNILTLHDSDVGFDITIKFQNISTPIIKVIYTDKEFGEGKFYEKRHIPKEVILPFSYHIDTFDD